MLPSDPDYPQVVMSFTYRGFRLDLDQSEDHELPVFSVWASYATGYGVAVPAAVSRTEAICRAKQWVDRKLQDSGRPVRRLRIV
ncbi:MAG: hypothetical protein ACFCVD_12625 [Nodosilinea sp.]